MHGSVGSAYLIEDRGVMAVIHLYQWDGAWATSKVLNTVTANDGVILDEGELVASTLEVMDQMMFSCDGLW